MTRKMKIEAGVDDDKVGFTISKSSAMSRIELLGILQVITQEITSQLEDEIKITKQ